MRRFPPAAVSPSDPSAPLPGMTTYAELLEEAWELGRADGRFAAAFEPAATAPLTGERCLGRKPAEFASLLWEDQPGNPPSGLEGNAPLWYASGFAEGLAQERRRMTEPLVVRWVFS
jgi:hypothetical protein